MRKSIFLILFLSTSLFLFAGDSTETKISEKDLAEFTAYFKKLDSVEAQMKYQTGRIKLSNNIASLNVPSGFKFVNAEQSRYIIEKLWENLPDESVLGMIVKDSFAVNKLTGGWAFIVSYDAMGYVKDDDADAINYNDLLKESQENQKKANLERKKLGYDAMEIIGWASQPYYDKQQKVLHWAKNLKIEGSETNTLNYDVRVLGRKGVLSLNAVASMEDLQDVKKNIPQILAMSEFESGNKYSEFDPSVDAVAAWTIGGLVAGKVLAKAGFFVVLLKSWKIIALAIAGAGGTIWRFITGKRKSEQFVPEQIPPPNEPIA